MLRNIRKRAEGFTIVEVIIVLAIAALILLIVLLAIPALQRNSRNSGRKNDVARIGAAVTEFVSNRNGALPSNSDLVTIRDSIGNMNQYDFSNAGLLAGNFSIVTQASAGTTTINNVNQVRVVTGAICNSNNDGSTVAGSSRQMVLQYAVEDADGGAGQAICQPI